MCLSQNFPSGFLISIATGLILSVGVFSDFRIRPQILDEYGSEKSLQVNGLTFTYVEAGNRNNPLMLFLHGNPGFWFSWRYQLRDICQDYWCVAVNTRGVYPNEVPSLRVRDYFIGYLADDVKGIVENLGREKFILVGHDWGGIISWAFLAKYEQMVEKFVILNGPILHLYLRLIFTDPEQFVKSLYVFFFQTRGLPELLISENNYFLLEVVLRTNIRSISQDEIDAYKYTYSLGQSGDHPIGLTPQLNYYRSVIQQLAFIPRPSYRNLKVPGLFIFGVNDNFESPRVISQVRNAVPSIKIALVQNASHFVQEDSPADVNSLILQYLSE